MTEPRNTIWITEIDGFDYLNGTQKDAERRVETAQLMGFSAFCYEAPKDEFVCMTAEHRSLYENLMRKSMK